MNSQGSDTWQPLSNPTPALLKPLSSSYFFSSKQNWCSQTCRLEPSTLAGLQSIASLLPGHLLSTAEVESALVEHAAVSEAAVVSHPHPLKGECLYCFVTLRDGHEFTQNLADELKKQGSNSQTVGRSHGRERADGAGQVMEGLRAGCLV